MVLNDVTLQHLPWPSPIFPGTYIITAHQKLHFSHHYHLSVAIGNCNQDPRQLRHRGRSHINAALDHFFPSRLGSSDPNKVLNFFVLFTQVGPDRSCCKSNDICLTLLPSLQAYGAIASFHIMALLLLGDIEQNQGPSTQEMFAQILDNNRKVAKYLEEIKTRQTLLDAAMPKVNNRFSGIEPPMSDFCPATEKIKECQAEIVRLTSTLSGLELKIDKL